MEKRVFLAILALVRGAGRLPGLISRRRRPPAAAGPSVGGPDVDADRCARRRRRARRRSARGRDAGADPVRWPTPLVADDGARDIVVETDAVRAVFSTAGATLRSWQLKKYLENGQPLELVPSGPARGRCRGRSRSRPTTRASRATLATAFYKPSAASLTLGSAPGTLTFEYRDPSGLNARKTFYFQPEGKAYVLKVEAAIDVSGTSRPVTIARGRRSASATRPTDRRACRRARFSSRDGTSSA